MKSFPIKQSGFTLVELMVAMTLGLILSAAMVGVFTTNQTAVRTTDELSRMQESIRLSFEFMAREIREAGSTVCAKNLSVVNVLNNADTVWWSTWGDAVRGYDASQAFSGVAIGDSVSERLAGTDAIQLLSGSGMDTLTIVDHVPSSAQFKLNTTAHGIVDDDIVMACDYSQASIFQITNASDASETMVHNTGTGSVGNCTKGLGIPRNCTTNGTPYEYSPHSQLVRLNATAWYVGLGSNGRPSLYRATRSGAQEIAPGVTSLDIQYLVADAADYVDATAVVDWGSVIAVRLQITVESESENANTNGGALTRNFEHIVAVRSRV